MTGPRGRWRDERDGPGPVLRGGFGLCYADCDGCRAVARASFVRCAACGEIVPDDEALFSVVSPGEHQLMCSVCATLRPGEPGREHVDVALARPGVTRCGSLCDCGVGMIDGQTVHAVDCAVVWGA